MATRAERFRYALERSGPKLAKKQRTPPRSWTVDTSLPGISASDRRSGAGASAARNESARAARKAAYVLEDSATGRPSRKSTRRSANRLKNDRRFQAKLLNAASHRWQ